MSRPLSLATATARLCLLLAIFLFRRSAWAWLHGVLFVLAGGSVA